MDQAYLYSLDTTGHNTMVQSECRTTTLNYEKSQWKLRILHPCLVLFINQLTISHQLRLHAAYQAIKQLLKAYVGSTDGIDYQTPDYMNLN